ncbi:hypothetical protein [Leptospira adleri]|uniref:hypothetical protein n=1 Tax=Leptospira adleri TaxID=2023186 RepID=UPI001082F82F|nr:hypothetical protein [Leptospira adleri]TGM57120.1 hypothetical protein EHQ97_10510 [Leptospira adleri]
MDNLQIIKNTLLEILKNIHFWGVIGSFFLQSIIFQNKSTLLSLGILSLLVLLVSLFLAVYPLYGLFKLFHKLTSSSIQGIETSFQSFLSLLIKFHGKYFLTVSPFIVGLLIGFNNKLFTIQDFNKPHFVIFSTCSQVLYLLFLLIAIGSRDQKNLFKKFVLFFTQSNLRLLCALFFLSNFAQKIFWVLIKESTDFLHPIVAYGIYGLLILFNIILFITLTKDWEASYFGSLKEREILKSA